MDGTAKRSAWLKGPGFPCTHIPTATRPWRLVLLGAPGVGKGTQAELLAAENGANGAWADGCTRVEREG